MTTTSFASIYAIAAERKGEEALAASLQAPGPVETLRDLGDDRYLAQMAKRVFCAGFVWRVVEAKWPGFEEAFEGFDPEVLVEFGDTGVDILAKDARIIRNRQKILATVANAHFVQQVSEEHGSFGDWIADWPTTDIVGLWAALSKGGSRLGGATGPMFLRYVGKDTFMLSKDVVARLVVEDIVPKKPTSKKALAKVQTTFNTWAEESGLSLQAMSRVLACSIDA